MYCVTGRLSHMPPKRPWPAKGDPGDSLRGFRTPVQGTFSNTIIPDICKQFLKPLDFRTCPVTLRNVSLSAPLEQLAGRLCGELCYERTGPQDSVKDAANLETPGSSLKGSGGAAVPSRASFLIP